MLTNKIKVFIYHLQIFNIEINLHKNFMKIQKLFQSFIIKS